MLVQQLTFTSRSITKIMNILLCLTSHDIQILKETHKRVSVHQHQRSNNFIGCETRHKLPAPPYDTRTRESVRQASTRQLSTSIPSRSKRSHLTAGTAARPSLLRC